VRSSYGQAHRTLRDAGPVTWLCQALRGTARGAFADMGWRGLPAVSAVWTLRGVGLPDCLHPSADWAEGRWRGGQAMPWLWGGFVFPV